MNLNTNQQQLFDIAENLIDAGAKLAAQGIKLREQLAKETGAVSENFDSAEFARNDLEEQLGFTDRVVDKL